MVSKIILARLTCCQTREIPADITTTPALSHSLTEVGPASTPLARSHIICMGNNTSTTGKPAHARQSISLPALRDGSITVSEEETPKATPMRNRTSIRRLRDSIRKRFSQNADPENASVSSEQTFNMDKAPSTSERRQELKRALHRRVEKELRIENPYLAGTQEIRQSDPLESQPVEFGHATAAKKSLHRFTASVSSKKSIRDNLESLPTVTEHPDTSRLSEAQKDDTVESRSKISVDCSPQDNGTHEVEDLGGSTTFGRDAPGDLTELHHPEQATQVSELPEVFVKLKKAYGRRSCSTSGSLSIYKPHQLADVDPDADKYRQRSEVSTPSVVDEIFRPLENSPQKLGLWNDHLPGIGMLDSSSGHSPPNKNYLANQFCEAQTLESRPTEDTSSREHAANSPHTSDKSGARANTSSSERTDSQANDQGYSVRSEHASMGGSLRAAFRRALSSPIFDRMLPFKQRLLGISTSMPSLRGRKCSNRPSVSPISTSSFRTLPARLQEGHGLRTMSPMSSTSSTSLEPHSDEDDPFVEKSVNRIVEMREQPILQQTRRHKHTSSLQSETESFRAKEIAAVSRRIISQHWKDQPSRRSRFKEMLDISTPAPARRISPATVPRATWARRGIGAFDGEDLPLQGIKRTYTVSDFMESQNSARSVWERALQDHAFEMALKTSDAKRQRASGRPVHPQLGHTSHMNKGKRPVRRSVVINAQIPRSDSDPDISPGASVPGSVTHKPSQERIGETERTQQVTDEEARKIFAAGRMPGNMHTPDSWVHFPSHTRGLRNGSAGAGDSVHSFDFGKSSLRVMKRIETADLDPGKPLPSVRTVSLDMNSGGSANSFMRFPEVMMKLAARIRGSVSMDLRRSARRGMRSSISAGGEVKAPELELLGLGAPVPIEYSEADVRELEFRSSTLSRKPERLEPSDEEILIGQQSLLRPFPAARRPWRPGKTHEDESDVRPVSAPSFISQGRDFGQSPLGPHGHLRVGANSQRSLQEPMPRFMAISWEKVDAPVPVPPEQSRVKDVVTRFEQQATPLEQKE